MRITRLLKGSTPLALFCLAMTSAICALFALVILNVIARVAIEFFIPSVMTHSLYTEGPAQVGKSITFTIEGMQRPSCIVTSARFLHYKDTNVIVPLTDVRLPNIAVAQSGPGIVDTTQDSRYVKATFVLPLPKMYVMPGVARLEIQGDDTACGYLNGYIPAKIHHWIGGYITLLPANKD